MKQLAHLVRTDVRHFRWVLAFWCVAVAAEAAVVGVRPLFIAEPKLYGGVGAIAVLLWIALQVSLLFLVPAIVQAHAAVGTDAFWTTRPIPRPTLWASKVVLLGSLTVVLPAIAVFALAQANHVSMREAALVALDDGLSRFQWVGVLMAAAVLTATLARFALLLGAVFGGLLLIAIVSIASFGAFSTEPPRALNELPSAPDPTGHVVFMIGFVVATIVLVAVQYHTRLRRAAVVAGTSCVLLVALAAAYWPVPLLRAASAVPAWATDPGRVPLFSRSRKIVVADQMTWPMEEGLWRTGYLDVALGGVPPGWQPRVMLLGASLTLPGGARIESRRRDYAAAAGIGGWDESTTALVARDVLGVRDVWTEGPPTSEHPAALVVNAAELDEAVHTAAAYEGRFSLTLTHWEIAGSLPLARGAVLQDGSYRVVIEDVTSEPSYVMIRARQSRATSPFDRRPIAAYEFYLRNADRSQALAASMFEPPVPMPRLPGMSVNFAGEPWGFVTQGIHINVPRSTHAPDMPLFDRDWLSGAELVAVRKTEAGAIMRTIEIPAVSIVKGSGS